MDSKNVLLRLDITEGEYNGLVRILRDERERYRILIGELESFNQPIPDFYRNRIDALTALIAKIESSKAG